MKQITPEILKVLADAQGWTIASDDIAELVTIYNGIVNDTRLVQQIDLGDHPPSCSGGL